MNFADVTHIKCLLEPRAYFHMPALNASHALNIVTKWQESLKYYEQSIRAGLLKNRKKRD